nr:TetR/AcrR family transcriptional regulator C-terminal domain-containing protein [uncultured Oscillibacter sp.]
MGIADNSAKVQQTKRILAEKLMELLERKSFKRITVNDICQSAMVSRSTFYLHFDDKYQLFQYCIEQELRWLETAIVEKDIKTVICLTLDMLLEKKAFYYNTLTADPDQELGQIFMDCFCQFFAAQIETRRKTGREIPGPVLIVSAFYAGGITAANIQWIKSKFSISKEDVADCQQRLLSGLLD